MDHFQKLGPALAIASNVISDPDNHNLQKNQHNLMEISRNFDFSEKKSRLKYKINENNANTYVLAGQINFLRVLSFLKLLKLLTRSVL